MGNLGAIGMADAVKAGQVTMAAAMEWHLAANHYPPVGADWIPTCIDAVRLASGGSWEVTISTPRGPKDVRWIVEQLHLYPFIEEES